MPRITPGFRKTALTIAALLAAYPCFAGGATPTSYIGLDGGLWSDPTNWSNGLPNSTTFDVVINNPSPITVQLDTGETINNLSLNSSDMLSLLAGLTIAGSSASNTGTIVFNSTASSSRLTFSNATGVSLSGGGSLLLSSPNSLITGNGGRLTTDNIISGQGAIGQGNLKITNNGTIAATAGTLTVAARNATDGFINTGILRADGGILALSPATYTNNNGLIEAINGSTVTIGTGAAITGGAIRAGTGSLVSISPGTITSASISGAGGTVSMAGLMQNLSLSGATSLSTGNSTFTGTIDNSGICSASSAIMINNAYVNNSGTISLFGFVSSSLGNATINNTGLITGLFTLNPPGPIASSPVAFTGGGTILTTSGFFVNQLQFMSDNFIRGTGSINSNTTTSVNSGTIVASGGSLSVSNFTNVGTLRADGGTLLIGGSLRNSGGVIEALSGSTVLTISGTVTGGLIRTMGNGTVSLFINTLVANATLSNASGTMLLQNIANLQNDDFNGSATISAPSLAIRSGLQNEGTLSIASTSETLDGVLKNSGSIIFSSSLGTMTFSASSGSVQNVGQITIGNILLVPTNLTLTGGGTIVLSNPASGLAGNVPGGSYFTTDNVITGQGVIGASPTINNSVAFKTANSGTITATSGTLSLVGQNATDGFVNTGILRADGGKLSILAPYVNNTNGTIQAFANSTVIISRQVIGGSAAVEDGGTLIFNNGATGVVNCPIYLASGGNAILNGPALAISSISGVGNVTIEQNTFVVLDAVEADMLSIGTNSGSFARKNGSNTGTSKLNSLLMATSSSGAFTSTLNLNDNKFILQSSGLLDKSTKASFLQSALASGMNDGNWMGTGITSGTVAANQSATGSHLTTLGLFDNADMGFTNFGGQSVDSNSLLIATALIGDANLDGSVGLTDFEDWYGHVLQALPFTEDGDFNHDGVVDGLDFDLWFNAAGANAQPILDSLDLDRADLSALRAAPVPEPATVALLLTISPILLRRRRKRMLPTFKP